MVTPMLDRRAAVAILLKDRGDLLVVTGLGSPTYDVHAAGDRDENYYLWGAMGGAALIGLGLALAQPKRPVWVITGDGEQLMALGGLATIAVAKPCNLSVVVIDNQHYGETGMQASHTGKGIDLAKIAAANGFAATGTIATMAASNGGMPSRHSLTGLFRTSGSAAQTQPAAIARLRIAARLKVNDIVRFRKRDSRTLTL